MSKCIICNKSIDNLSPNPDNWGIKLPYPGGNGASKEYCRQCTGEAVYEKYLLPDMNSITRMGTFLHQKIEAEELLMEIVEMGFLERAFKAKDVILQFFKKK